MSQPETFTPIQEDALKEIAGILIGHAATALARLSATRIDISVPSIRFLPRLSAIVAASGGSRVVAGVRTRILGRLAGEIYVVFPRDSALVLSDLVRGLSPGATRYMSAPAASALTEVGNVIAGACLAAFYRFFEISLIHSVPEFVYDVPDALVEGSAVSRDDRVLVAEVAFHAPDADLTGHLVLFFTVESMPVLLSALETPG